MASKINLHFTGSMFGVGATINDINSLLKINFCKKRSDGKSFIVLLSSQDELQKYVMVDERLQKFLVKFWPGNLTVVLPCWGLPHLALGNFVGFRVPVDKSLRKQLEVEPIVSTSVNVSGEEALLEYSKILEKYGSWFDEDWVPKGVKRAMGKPSTVVKVDKGQLICLRKGQIDFATVRESWDELG